MDESVCIVRVDEPVDDVCIIAVDEPKGDVCILSEEKEVDLVCLRSRGAYTKRKRTPDIDLTSDTPPKLYCLDSKKYDTYEELTNKSDPAGHGTSDSLPRLELNDQAGASNPEPGPSRPILHQQHVYADALAQGSQPIQAKENNKSKPPIQATTQENIYLEHTYHSSPDKTAKDSIYKQERRPTCWTVCPKCPPNNKKTYHLIDISLSSKEAEFVCGPLTGVSFEVVKVQRIQNDLLWERLMAEQKLMLRTRDFVNMQFLYHTTSAKPSIICEEGLDLRLSRQGNFGNGIYFSDMPIKCNSYWRRNTKIREIFVCRVLLGNCKEFPVGRRAPTLVREPAIAKPKPGAPKTYDSVKGSINGLNEFIVYNAYRVMPEYLIHYTLPE